MSSNVTKIYIFCRNKEYHSTWAKKYQKVSCVETNIQILINQIKQNLLEWYREISSVKVNLPAFAPIFNDTDKSEMNNLHRYLKVIPNFANRLQAKNDFLNLSKLIYTDLHNTKLIAEFEKSYNEYNKIQILRWYTKESFLYKVANNCLRIATSDSIQYCRLLLKDLEQAIKDQYQAKSKNFNGLLYRGAYLSQEEWLSLKENQDKEIEMHGFLSVSKEKNVALNFMRIDPSKKVLITILVIKGPTEEEQGFAEIEEFSLLPQEKEILFNVRSRFTVIETEDQYSEELTYRHLVLLYGAQGLRKVIAEQNPAVKVPIPNIQDISCYNCTHGTPETFLFRLLDKQIYYCKNCVESSGTTVFLCVPLKITPTAAGIDLKGCLLNSNQFNSPFYGYKCSQCQAKKEKRYFICTDCTLENKLAWCENCFTETLSCIQAQHNILLETHPYSFWCEKMPESELSHLKFHSHTVLNKDPIFLQAEMYSANHKYDQAIECYNLYIQQSKTKTKDPFVVESYSNLGDIYKKQQLYEKSLEAYSKSVDLLKNFSGEKRDHLASYFRRIGHVYYDQEKFVKALEYHSKALDLCKSLYGENHSIIASIYIEIGMVYRSQKEFNQALEYYFKAAEIKKSLNGENDDSVCATYNSIGLVYMDLKEHQKAEKYLLKALEIKKSIFREYHPSNATYYNNLSSVFYDQKEFDKALEYSSKALKISRSLHGENHPDVAFVYRNRGIIFAKQEDHSKALEYYWKALEISKTVYGENSSHVLEDYTNLIDVFTEQKEFTKLLECLLKSLEIKKSIYGENHVKVAESYEKIGEIYLNLKDGAKTLEYALKYLEIVKLSFEENSEEIAMYYFNIGMKLSDLGEYNKALEYHFKCLDIQKAIFEEDHPDFCLSYYSIAGVYMDQKEYIKALEYGLKSLEICTKAHGEDHDYTIKSKERLLEIQSCFNGNTP